MFNIVPMLKNENLSYFSYTESFKHNDIGKFSSKMEDEHNC